LSQNAKGYGKERLKESCEPEGRSEERKDRKEGKTGV